ncbi:hypothetical protein GOODEAATRI_028284 [Goodea atripinnis]|uniref:Uncharacterized protein n=1 Tax=Goodea atripinnis TaxID=208336 RepID=A0ABV0P8F7_9TELE
MQNNWEVQGKLPDNLKCLFDCVVCSLNDICCICVYYYVKDLSLTKTGSGTDEGEVTAATWIFCAAMHEAIGQRPSVNPVSLYSSGPSSVVVGPSQMEDDKEEEDTATLSAVGSVNSEVNSPESSASPPPKRPGKRKRKSNESAVEGLREWCENLERRQTENDDQDRAWLDHSQGQMDKILDQFGRLVYHLTK